MRTVLASLFCAVFASVSTAQTPDIGAEFSVPDAQVASTVLTIDPERLFAQSAYGRRIAVTYTDERSTLATENREIAEALREEELDLAARRPDMAPADFLAEAEAFDEKAQGIRRAQDAKEAALEETLANGREAFLVRVQPILGQIMVERGAFAILDRRTVFLSLGSLDITDIAIEEIDEAIGDGTSQSAEE